MGICAHSSTRALVKSGTDVGQEVLGLGLVFKEVRSGLNQVQAAQVVFFFFFNTNLGKPCLHGQCFVHWSRFMLEQV